MQIQNNYGIIRLAKGMPYFARKQEEKVIVRGFWIASVVLILTVIIAAAVHHV